MKKVLRSLLLIIVIFNCSLIKAQDSKVGIKGGLNLANEGGDTEGTSLRPSWHLGFFYESKISERFAIQPEIILSMQGSKTNLQVATLTDQLGYLNIPVMAKVFLSEKFNLQFGPQIGFLMSAKLTDGITELDIKDQFNGIDFALGFGLGYSNESMIFDLRYNAGLSDITKDENFGKITNNVIQFSIGKKFW